MASRARLVAVNKVVKSGGLDENGVDAAIVVQARDLARMLDKLEQETPPLNLLRLYDSALTKMQRAVERKQVANKGRKPVEPEAEDAPDPESPPALKIVEESALEKLRREKQARKVG